jgi:hypothetical protein
MSTRLYLCIALTLLGGISSLLIGFLGQQELFIGVGFVVVGATLSQWYKGTSLTGGWAGAATFGLIMTLSLGIIYVFQTQNCEELAPGIFLLMSLLSFLPAWMMGYGVGKLSGLKFAFPVSMPIFLALIGICIGLVSARWMSCGLDRSTLTSVVIFTYILGWSGLASAVRIKTPQL